MGIAMLNPSYTLSTFVMTGLDPAISDPRVKPGNDDESMIKAGRISLWSG
jgi:hypothetical protein